MPRKVICKELNKNKKNKLDDQPKGAIPNILLTNTYKNPKNEIVTPKTPSTSINLIGKFEKLKIASKAKEKSLDTFIFAFPANLSSLSNNIKS